MKRGISRAERARAANGAGEIPRLENVGAPTFKVTLEGNYLTNTGTMQFA
jgi:hypothetical protein